MNSERLKMIDLFSGAGGLSEGLSEAGFHSLFASEIVPVYAQTYKKIIRTQMCLLPISERWMQMKYVLHWESNVENWT